MRLQQHQLSAFPVFGGGRGGGTCSLWKQTKKKHEKKKKNRQQTAPIPGGQQSTKALTNRRASMVYTKNKERTGASRAYQGIIQVVYHAHICTDIKY